MAAATEDKNPPPPVVEVPVEVRAWAESVLYPIHFDGVQYDTKESYLEAYKLRLNPAKS